MDSYVVACLEVEHCRTGIQNSLECNGKDTPPNIAKFLYIEGIFLVRIVELLKNLKAEIHKAHDGTFGGKVKGKVLYILPVKLIGRKLTEEGEIENSFPIKGN